MSKWNYSELQNWILNGCDETDGLTVISLNINKSDLTRLPNEIFKLTNLQYLFCSYNFIRIIPTKIKQLTNLRTFVCSYNNIIYVPSSICELNKLELFNISNNMIKQLPVNIDKLTNLVELNCDWNEIIYLSMDLEKLPNLRIFRCDNNQLDDIPSQLESKLELFTYDGNHLSRKKHNDVCDIHKSRSDDTISYKNKNNDVTTHRQLAT